MFLFFHFLRPNVPDNKCHKPKWRVLFFTRIKLVASVLARVCAIARIKWRRLSLAKKGGVFLRGGGLPPCTLW